MYCVCTVYVLCMYCVCPGYVLCMYCVCTVYVLCMYCVCTVYVLCIYCVCTSKCTFTVAVVFNFESCPRYPTLVHQLFLVFGLLGLDNQRGAVRVLECVHDNCTCMRMCT